MVGFNQKEETWDFKVAVVVDLVAVGREKCSRPPAPIARKSAKFPSSPRETVRSIVGIASRSERIAAAKE